MGLPLRALEAGSPGYVVQQRRRAQGLHSHPGGAACTARAQATTRPRALAALIPISRLIVSNKLLGERTGLS